MKNTAFIINPKSSHQNVETRVEKIKKTFPESKIFFSKDKESTRKFIEEVWEEIENFVVVGGDGTVSSVASQLIFSDKKLAIFPSGSGNGFAREMGFNQNIDSLYKKLEKGNFISIDTFMLNQHFGINAAGVGFDAVVAQKFEHTKRGLWSYIKVCLKNYFSFKGVDIEIEDAPLLSGQYFFTTIANSRQFGNNAYIAPNAQLSDGLLEVVLVEKFPLWKSPLFAWQLFRGKIMNNPCVKTIQRPALTLSSNTDIWHIDGDYLSIPSPVHIRIQEKSLRILGVEVRDERLEIRSWRLEMRG